MRAMENLTVTLALLERRPEASDLAEQLLATKNRVLERLIPEQ